MGDAAIDAKGRVAMSPRRAITAAGIGNVLEYYDFGMERRADVILVLTTFARAIVCLHQVRRFHP